MDAHAAADLDQLAAAHRDPAATGQPDRERERRRVVRHHQPVLGARERDKMVLCAAISVAASAGRAIKLEEQGPRGGIGSCPDRGLRPRRTPEVRVHDHARSIEHASRTRPTVERREPGEHVGTKILRRSSVAGLGNREPRPLLVDDVARHATQRIGIALPRPRPHAREHTLAARGPRSGRLDAHPPIIAGCEGSGTRGGSRQDAEGFEAGSRAPGHRAPLTPSINACSASMCMSSAARPSGVSEIQVVRRPRCTPLRRFT